MCIDSSTSQYLSTSFLSVPIPCPCLACGVN